MLLKDFDYNLPDELIAQSPAQPRDFSRLLVYHRSNKKIEHKIFREITEYLHPGDAMVLNHTKVIPARLLGEKKDTRAAVEILLLKRLSQNIWEGLVRPGRRLKTHAQAVFGGGRLTAEIIDELSTGNRLIKFTYDGVFEQLLEELGRMPLPPYIKEELNDPPRYQTVYAEHPGSAAAPTAGLHFTPELLDKISNGGVSIIPVLLHIGLGTFRPVKEDDISQHKMHSEFCSISDESAAAINACRQRGGKIICVGTTSVRTLESMADENSVVVPGGKETDIFITPGYSFKAVDALVTNFHLPKSTLLMLVSAFMGREEALRVYNIAVEEKYRFFSFGDAMLIL